MSPSSMAKIMTVYMVLQRIEEGRLTLDDTLPVSERAWRTEGSKMWVELGAQIRVEDLLRGVIVQSGNDACVVLAEGLAGSEEAFAQQMTELARSWGLTSTNFINSSGWPDPAEKTTPRELAVIAQRLIEDFPQYYHYWSEKEFTWHDISQANRNPLLYRTTGADGLKTGHSEEAGYGLTASVLRDGRRLLLVVNGLASELDRAEESERLIEWGFREFTVFKLFEAGEVVEHAAVWYGDSSTVPLVAPTDLGITMPQQARENIVVSVVYDGAVPAPIAAGTPVARLVITAPDFPTQEHPLVAGADVAEAGIIGRLTTALQYLVLGY